MLTRHKNPEVDIKIMYTRNFELGIVIALFLFSLVFTISKKFGKGKIDEAKMEQVIIEMKDIPQTEQIKRPPPPPRPAVPIESESEDVPEDVTIEETTLDLTEAPPPPPPPPSDDESPIFIAYDEAPEMIGGLAALKRAIEYPELARKAGQEGKVFLEIVVDEKGNVIDARMLKGPAIFEEAAIKAIFKMKFRPAKQRDRSVKVRIAQVIEFRLR
jgi:protein TonB